MEAGFAKVCINPPLGTPVLWEETGGCEGIHDDIFVRALYLSHNGVDAVILGFDVVFFNRAMVDRYKGAIGRRVDLAPSRILLNTSHVHAGPRTSNWGYWDPDPAYLDQIGEAILEAVDSARANQKDVTVWAGMTRTDLPMSRRRLQPDGSVKWAPTPDGAVCDALPICLFRDGDDNIISLLFSVSCHPSMLGGYQISAEFPGAATRRLNAHFDTQGALFLQGTAGDIKTSVQADLEEVKWRGCGWEDVDKAGAMVADPAIACVEAGLDEVHPELAFYMADLHWPLQAPPERSKLVELRKEKGMRARWATDMLARLDRNGSLPTVAEIGFHALQIAREVRLFALEGEAVAEFGLMMLRVYDRGVTFPLAYTDGAQLYLPVDRMHEEGGYEVTSYYEYHYPAALQPVGDALVEDALTSLKEKRADSE